MKVTGSATASKNINNTSNGSTIPLTVTSTSLTLTVTAVSNGGGSQNTLTWQKSPADCRYSTRQRKHYEEWYIDVQYGPGAPKLRHSDRSGRRTRSFDGEPRKRNDYNRSEPGLHRNRS